MVSKIRLQLALICADTCPGNSSVDHELWVGLVSSCGQEYCVSQLKLFMTVRWAITPRLWFRNPWGAVCVQCFLPLAFPELVWLLISPA